MRAIVQDLKARLSAALGDEVPVLLPEQREQPTQGRRPGGAGGLSGYLQTHAQGYVQLEEAQGVLSSLGGAAGLWLVQLACLGATPDTAENLARRALAATASRAGGPQTPYDLTTPPGVRASAPGVFVSTFILTARKGL